MALALTACHWDIDIALAGTAEHDGDGRAVEAGSAH